MQWERPKRMDGGPNGFYQQGENGYAVTYTQTGPDRAVFNASCRKVSIGTACVDPRNKELVREMGRVMRMMCGAHANATEKRRA